MRRIASAAVLTALLAGGLPAGAQAAPPDSREQALAAALALQTAARVPVGWTGSVGTCSVGTESAASLQATLDAVNLLRSAAGVPPVTFDPALNQKALASALIMAGQQQLSHYPAASWTCYNAAGSEAAARSNLAIGFGSGPAAMLGYAHDEDVASLGHRHWLLDPKATKLGSGSTGPLGDDRLATNALWVIDGGPAAAVPAGKQVAWPPAGHVPFEWLPKKWSIAVGAPGQAVNVSAAHVRMTLDGTPLADPAVDSAPAGYGTGVQLGWTPTFDSARLEGEQHTFDVAIDGVTVDAVAVPIRYTVRVDNLRPGAPTSVQAGLAGLTSADVTWSAPPINGGSIPTGYQVKASPGGATCSTTIWAVGWDNRPVRRPAAPTTCRVGGLTAGVSYTFTVTAQNEAGGGPASGASNVVRPVGPPHAPVGLTAAFEPSSIPGVYKVTLAWSPPASDGGSPVTGYSVILSDGQVQSVTSTSATFGRLNPGTAYTAQVRALNAIGTSSAAGQVVFTTPAYQPVDSDGDGVGDDLDQCPAVPGTPLYAGCPPPTPIPQPPAPQPKPQPKPKPVVPAPPKGPAVVVKVKATSKRSKLAVDVDPNKGKGYWSFQVQRLDQGTWKALKTYRTTGKKEKKTVNLPKGTYRVVVLAKYGHRTTTSGSVVLVK